MKTADLHLHTIFSDGTDTPERVVELAKEAGLSAIAITDHDNIEAYDRAQPAARQQGIELLTGIEMSASIDGTEIHILGFLIDRVHAGLNEYLALQQSRRVDRAKEMVRRLRETGVNIEAEEVLSLSKQGTIGRPHVAQVLLKHGYISSIPEAFTRYIGPENPGFVPGSPTAPADILHIIRDAGGVPVLAHPIYMKRDELIEQFVQEGLAGLEVYHSGHAPDDILHYERIADRLKLLSTGGSDYHGVPKEGVPVGTVKASYEQVEALKAWQRANPSAS